MSKSLMNNYPDRLTELLRFVPTSGKCLEVAPFHRPALKKSNFDVDYADYASTAELVSKLPEGFDANSVCDVDYVWQVGQSLASCLPKGVQYDFAIASHVMEHVPNVLGWVQQVLDVLKPGAILQLALPNRDGCFDAFRRTTAFSEMLQNWIIDASTPTVSQMFDFVGHNVTPPDGTDHLQTPYESHLSFKEYPHDHSIEFAFTHAMNHYQDGTYMDTHCSVFTRESFAENFTLAQRLGILNVTVSYPIEGWREFFVTLTKMGEPRHRREKFHAFGTKPAPQFNET